MFIPWMIALFLGLVTPTTYTNECNGGGTVQLSGTGEDGGDDGADGPGSGTGTGGGAGQNPPPPPPPPPPHG